MSIDLEALRGLLDLLQEYGVHDATVNGISVKMAVNPMGPKVLDGLTEDEKKQAVIAALKQKLAEDQDLENWSTGQ